MQPDNPLVVAVVIPALDEAGTIRSLVREVRQTVPTQLIVVDNGSTDHTAEEAAAAGAQVVVERRRGYGYACAAGAARAVDAVAQPVAGGGGEIKGASLLHSGNGVVHSGCGGSTRNGSKQLEVNLRAELAEGTREVAPGSELHTPRARCRELRAASRVDRAGPAPADQFPSVHCRSLIDILFCCRFLKNQTGSGPDRQFMKN